MNNIVDFIQEKLRIDKNIKIDKEFLEPEDFTEMETPGFNWDGEEMILVGKPFKHKNTKAYIETKDYIIKTPGYKIYNDYEDIDDKEDFEYFVYARYDNDKELNCFVYPNAVYALEK